MGASQPIAGIGHLGGADRGCIFVVIPAFNENAILRSTVSDVLRYGYSVVVVDDGSTSPARDCLDNLPAYCVRHAVNLGQGAALQTGSDFALSKGAAAVVHFDADGQHEASAIDRLVSPIIREDADVAFGSRFLTSSDANNVPAIKRVLLKAAILVSWVFTGMWLSDSHNGLRALSRHAASLVRLNENGFAHATEILGVVRQAGLSWVEVPVPVHYTEYSRCKGQSVFNAVNIVIDLVLRRVFP